MAARKITDLTALTTPTTNTLVPVVDLGEALPANQNKKLTLSDLTKGLSAATTGAAGVVQLSTSTSSTSTTLAATPSAVKSAYDLAAAALPLAGGIMTGAITFAGAQPRLVQDTAKASTSGTTVEFTGIPSWVKRITVMLNGVSTSGSSNYQVELGDSGGYETSGYSGNAIMQGVANVNLSAGFVVSLSTASTQNWTGTLVLTNVSGNIWIANGQTAIPGGFGGGAANVFTAGTKTLSDILTQLRITTAGGSDTFDAGTINILYEG